MHSISATTRRHQEAWGSVCCTNTAQRSQPPSPGARPTQFFRIPPHSPETAWQLPQVGLLAELPRFIGHPFAPKFLSHWQKFMPWVQGCPAVPPGLRPNTSLPGLLPRVSQAGTTIQDLALSFTLKPRAMPWTKNKMPGSCFMCQAPPSSSHALSPGPGPLPLPPCPWVPHPKVRQ